MKNKAAQDMARRRHDSLTPEARKAIARKAAQARWRGPVVEGRRPGRCSMHKRLNCPACGGTA